MAEVDPSGSLAASHKSPSLPPPPPPSSSSPPPPSSTLSLPSSSSPSPPLENTEPQIITNTIEPTKLDDMPGKLVNTNCDDDNDEEAAAARVFIEDTDEPYEYNKQNSTYEQQPRYPQQFQDITTEFFTSVKELELGELVHHEIFGLFEAMSAIEMMDPKMDAGMCCNKNAAPPLTFETALWAGKLKLINLEKCELIGIMDGMFSCLVSWLEGHSLAQTLFTCLYLHQPYQINDKTLKAFSFAMHKLSQIIKKFVFVAQVYEEEDFESRDYDYTLTPDISNLKACCMLKEVEDELTKKIKNLDTAQSPSTSSSPSSVSSSLSSTSSSSSSSTAASATTAPAATTTTTADVIEQTQAIINRLRFLRLYLQALVAIWPDKRLSPNETEMVEIQRLLSGAIDLIPIIKKTISIGTQPEPGSEEPNPMGFSPMVNQRILPPTFPRFTKIKDRLSSITFLEELVIRTRTTCKVIHCTNYQNALNFFMDFSKKSNPCILSRSILQCLYFPFSSTRFGMTPITDVLRDSVKIFISPPVLMPRNPISTNHAANKWVDAFFSQCMYSFATFIHLCGYNKARQRDKLARLLYEFGSIVVEAERVDNFLNSLNGKDKEPQPYFSTWTLYHCLRAMSMYLLTGFELELYSVHEYIYIFWCLSHFLYNLIVGTLSRAECLSELYKSTTGTKIKKNKSGKKVNREIVLNQALCCMFTGYFKALTGFTKEGRIPQPLSQFDNEKVRFDHRFSPFAGITTLPAITYNEFAKMRTYFWLKTDVANLYLDAGKHFHRARFLLESLANPDAEIADIIRVSKINFVVMNLLSNGHKKDSKTPPIFDFSIHKYFPTIKQP